MASDRRLMRGATLTLMALVLSGLARAATRIAAGRLFGVEALGIVTLAMSTATVAVTFGAAALTPAITKLVSELRGSERVDDALRLAAVSARIGLGASVAGAIIGGLYVATNPSPGTSGTATIMGTSILTFAFGLYLTGKAITYGQERIGPYVRRELIGAALFALGLAGLILVDRPALILVPLILAYTPVALVALRHLGLRTGQMSDLPMGEYRHYALIGIVGSFAGIGFTQVTPIAASYIDVARGAALIGAVLTLLEPLNLAPRALSLVLLPGLAFRNAAGDRAQGSASLRLSSSAVAIIAAPAFALLVLERDRILQPIFSESIVGGMNLAWFAGAFLLSVIGAPAITALAAISAKRATISMWSSLAGFGTAAGIWFAAGSYLAVPAIGLGYLVGSILKVTAPIVVATRDYCVDWGSFWIRLGIGVALTVLLALPEPAVWIDALGVTAILSLLLPEIREIYTLIRGRVGRQSKPTAA